MKQTQRFIKAFYATMAREWGGIDRLRMDKFYNLIRCFQRETFVYLVFLLFSPLTSLSAASNTQAKNLGFAFFIYCVFSLLLICFQRETFVYLVFVFFSLVLSPTLSPSPHTPPPPPSLPPTTPTPYCSCPPPAPPAASTLSHSCSLISFALHPLFSHVLDLNPKP